MRKYRVAVIVASLCIVAATTAFAGEAWFDWENCAMCKNLSSHPELMKSTTWEQLNISNGIVAVTTVDSKYIKEYREAHVSMEETGKRLMGGEEMAMCQSCMALGSCMMKGVKQEYVETKNGDVWIIMSDDPEVVAELQTWAKRNLEEIAKMSEAKM